MRDVVRFGVFDLGFTIWKRGRTRSLVASLAVLSVLATALVSSATEAAVAQAASRQANGDSFDPIVSADGRLVAYESAATNLIDSDTNASTDIFVTDLQAGTTTRVSVSSSGEQANGTSADPFISADGTHVLFESLATNLVAGDTNARRDIFVHDLGTGQTERLSVSSSGTQANGNSFDPMEEEDGGIVSFSSDATNLVFGDTNGARDIFVRNRSTNVTTRASVSSSGTQANGDSDHPAVSPDGRYVGFPSEASNLVSSDTNAAWDVFVKDLTGGTTIRVSVGANGQANSDSPARAWMSDFANQIAFASEATNLVSGDTNAVQDIFVRNRLASTTERSSVSTGNPGGQSNGFSDLPSITSDGRYVGYSSDGSNLVSGDTNAARDVFVRDRTAKTTVAASVNSSGQLGNGASDRAMIAGAGRYVVFHSAATNLVASDTNAVTDVFMRDMTSGTTQLVSMGINRPPTVQLSVDPEEGDTGTTFTATISASDPDGDALTYEIDWDDGATSASASASHQYSSADEYFVVANVTDEWGNTGNAIQSVQVCTALTPAGCASGPSLGQGDSIVDPEDCPSHCVESIEASFLTYDEFEVAEANPLDRPAKGLVWYRGFDRKQDENDNGVQDFFDGGSSPHSRTDFEKFSYFEHIIGGGEQRLRIESDAVISGTRRGGDVGFHKAYKVLPDDRYVLKARVKLTNVDRAYRKAFRARLTIHMLDATGDDLFDGPVDECNEFSASNEWRVIRIRNCPLLRETERIRVNARAHARRKAQDNQVVAGHGTVIYDWIKFVRAE